MLDTGVWPESKSFSDEGFSPPPSKWKGSCQTPSNFTCNNKIIGAKFYRSDGEIGVGDFKSPRDSEGHGTHTASTAAGGIVDEASLFGLGSGTARGGVPSARLAVYKICWSDGCYDADILAAFDDAIADGVDIISLSVGGSFALDYFDDPIAIGAFHSMKNGILTSNSAGNSGPDPATITNLSPWSLSVAASTIDRKFIAFVQLGNKKLYEGFAVNTFISGSHPIVYGGDVPNIAAGYTGADSRYCFPDSLDNSSVAGKIVFCDELSDGEGALQSGAIGTIMQDGGFKDHAFSFPLSTSYLTLEDGAEVLTFINTTSKPTATILQSIDVKDSLAPFVVSFSSRGPNPITSDLLKPDLTAPGVDIVASWSEATTVTGLVGDKRVVPYNIISGTSMSCPHATGAAAYVKSFHPTWSPAAIKSALMTTASTLSAAKNTDVEFAYGSGQIDPIKAAQPGLIYDAGEADFIKFLCGQGYSSKSLQIVTGDNTTCTSATNGTVWDLNYPSFALSAESGTSFTRTFHRTVTNVGTPASTYKAVTEAPSGLSIKVEPSVLSFNAIGQKQSFTVTVAAKVGSKVLSGSLVWDDGAFQSIDVKDSLAPFVVSFSSRGPNPITSDLLKPDLTAPGVDIVASWSEATTVTGLVGDKRVVPYNIISGTSMSCPHATGAAAYVKSFHPTWSPAAIKSALMTTASTLSAAKNTDVEFAYGSGQIDPIKAAQPGLIYDAGEADFIKFLCGQGYSSKSLQIVTGDNTTCTSATNGTVWDLNYPSFALSAESGTSFTRTFHRTVTNVGTPASTYKAVTKAPSGLSIKVEPSVLSFNAIGQKQSFTVTVAAKVGSKVLSGSLVWDDGAFQVRSPVVAYSTSS
uniref:Cucumisin-like n=1 Tax=Daucus carota subsp. sativus TaxID=79200 RepID=A0A161Y1G7_DAUCS